MGYRAFDEYCEQRWGWTGRPGFDHGSYEEEMLPERQARDFSRLKDPELIRNVSAIVEPDRLHAVRAHDSGAHHDFLNISLIVSVGDSVRSGDEPCSTQAANRGPNSSSISPASWRAVAIERAHVAASTPQASCWP